MSAASAVAPVFAALGDETRLRLVGRLSSGKPESIARLCEGSRLSRQAITKHLDVLSRAGLVRDRRVGRERVFSLQGRKLAEVRKYLDRVSAQWDDALGRLKAFVEG
jgi:DNA-binding transcriptional ArsR family regulator